MTLASLVVNGALDVDIVPHTPFTLISTLPSKQLDPLTRRNSTKKDIYNKLFIKYFSLACESVIIKMDQIFTAKSKRKGYNEI